MPVRLAADTSGTGLADTRLLVRSFTPTTGVLWLVSRPGRGFTTARRLADMFFANPPT